MSTVLTGNMSAKGAALAALMQQRLTTVTEEICALFERTIVEYEEELAHAKAEIQRKQQLLDSTLSPAVHIYRHKDVQIHPSAKELTPALDQEDPPSSKRDERFTCIPDLSVRDAHSQTGCKDGVHVKQEPERDEENQINGEEHRGVKRSLKRKTTSQSPVRRLPQKRNAGRKLVKVRNGRKKSKAFKCDECSKVYKGQGHLNRHLRVHRKLEPTAASGSESQSEGLSSSAKGEGVSVSKRANRETRFKCSDCEKVFDRRSTLKAHMGVHTNWKLSSYELVRHNEVYSCPICKEDFRRKVDVSTHFRAAHSKPFRCSLCRNKYTTEAALRKHELYHTGQATVYNCHFCCKTFVGKAYFMKHMEQHSANEDSASEILFTNVGL